jgi:hypothetical protein
MDTTLFSLTNVAILAWALLVIFPRSTITRLMADTAEFPVSLVYTLVRFLRGKRHTPEENRGYRAQSALAPTAHGNRLTLEYRSTFLTGLTGIVLGLVGLLILAVHGSVFLPNGDLTKAISFNFACGIYGVTVALLLPLADFSPRGRRLWGQWFVGLGLAGYAIENIQTFRGLKARFSFLASPPDQLLGATLNFVGVGLLVMFLIFAWRTLRRPTAGADGVLMLGVRYACVSTVLAYAVGMVMFAIGGSSFGETGNLLPLHAIGFHGLQAVPLVALQLRWSTLPADVARHWVHAAGLSWLGVALAVAVQTALGRSVLEPAPAMLLAVVMFGTWAATALRAAVAWYHGGLRLPQDA